MNELRVAGSQKFMGKEIPVVAGGFGENAKCISDKTVAEIHGIEIKHVRELINRNIKRFKLAVDIIDLKAIVLNDNNLESSRSERPHFYSCAQDAQQSLEQLGYTQMQISKSEHIYILSERGYAKLIKIMDTDLAWEIHDKLMDEYFRMKEEKKLSNTARKSTNTIHIPSPVNTAAKILKDTYSDAGVDPLFIAVAVNNLYKESTGYDSGIPLLTEDAHLYDKTAIAEKFGICSKSGKPHPQAVGAIISKLEISADECVNTPYNKNGHSGVDVQYKESVCGKVEDWLSCHGYPTEIISESGKKLSVTYK